MRCAICKKRVETTFLEKIKGTYLKKNSKKYAICRDCQKIHRQGLKDKI